VQYHTIRFGTQLKSLFAQQKANAVCFFAAPLRTPETFHAAFIFPLFGKLCLANLSCHSTMMASDTIRSLMHATALPPRGGIGLIVFCAISFMS